MPLSTVLGAQSLVQPAVCTTATRPASPYTGQAIYDTTLSQVLVYNGTAFVPTGKIAQVVSTFKSDAFSTTSTSFVDVTGLTVSVTPTLNTSKILIMAMVSTSASTTNDHYLNLNRDSTAICQTTSGSTISTAHLYIPSNAMTLHNPIIFLDSPATTSAIAYKIQAKVGSDTMYVNRRGADTTGSTSTITVFEVLA
jgi:hypothetical protein